MLRAVVSIANPDNEDEVEDEHRDSNSIRTRRCCERRPPYPHRHSPQILTSVLIIKTRAGGVEGYQCKWDALTLCLHLA